MVVDAQNKPQQKAVKVGIHNGDNVQITAGLHAGERVVTAGAYDLSKEDPDVLEKTKVQISEPPPPSLKSPEKGAGGKGRRGKRKQGNNRSANPTSGQARRPRELDERT